MQQQLLEYNGEFGYELSLVIPYAYYLHQNGLLKETKSVKGTKELYYFSPKHTETNSARHCKLAPGLNSTVGVRDLNYSQWTPPPYKQFFKNDQFVFNKPLYIVHNKYTREWGGAPVNFLNVQTLEKIFDLLTPTFQVIYIRPDNTSSGYVCDDNPIQKFNDFEMIRQKFSEVIIFQDLLKLQTKVATYNNLQLMLHANCDHFISVQGGNSYLASYFEGTNLVYAVKGSEVNRGSFDGFIKKLSNCNICHVSTYDSLINKIQNNLKEAL